MSPQAPENRADASAPTTSFRRRRTRDRPAAERLSVDIGEAAEMIGVSYTTLWRAIRDNQFPGVRIRDRILVPVRAINMLLDSACESGELVDAAAWTAQWANSVAIAPATD
jgi:excisionase family DNA binding protein